MPHSFYRGPIVFKYGPPDEERSEDGALLLLYEDGPRELKVRISDTSISQTLSNADYHDTQRAPCENVARKPADQRPPKEQGSMLRCLNRYGPDFAG